MARCYLVAVCTGSSLDVATNNLSLFHLIEQMQVPQIPIFIPFEVQAYFEVPEAERGVTFEYRLVYRRMPEDVESTTPVGTFEATKARQRLRIGASVQVTRPGHFEIWVEWRVVGSEPWERSGSYWPLTIDLEPSAAE